MIDSATIDDLKVALGDVATARAKAYQLQRELAAIRQQFEAKIADQIEEAKWAQEDVANREETARILAVQIYSADKAIGKKFVDGVTIQDTVRQSLKYDSSIALRWALSKQMCVQLDVKAFETIALADPTAVTVDEKPVVSIKETVRCVAALGKDLSAYAQT